MRIRLVLAAVSFGFAACATTPAAPSDSIAMRAADEDAHHIVASDWFVSQEPYQAGQMAVLLSSLVTAPSDASKGEGEYMVRMDGQKVWAKYQYRTRPAAKEDLKVGAIVILADKNIEGLFQGPEDRAEALRLGWFMGTITDLTDLHKNEVAVSGEFRVRPEALRVIVAGQ